MVSAERAFEVAPGLREQANAFAGRKFDCLSPVEQARVGMAELPGMLRHTRQQ